MTTPPREAAGAALAAIAIACAAAFADGPAAAPAGGGSSVDPVAARLRDSVIKFKCKLEPRSAIRPWKLEPVQEVGGSGVVIAPGRVLTNAHVVHEATEVLLETDRTALPVAGRVLAVDVGRDLALVEADDADFVKAHPPVELLAGLPQDGARVTVMGYPLGGESLSTTSGVVSRSEWDELGSNGEEGMRVQVDAAVNFGNSGGPAFVDGRIGGLAFSAADNAIADNISYLIATEEIRRFLEESESGAITGNCVLHADYQPMENPALRARLGVGSGTSGVVVLEDKDGLLKPWDIITAVNGSAVDNKGQVTVEDGRKVDLGCAFGRFRPTKEAPSIPVEVIRAGRRETVQVPADGGRNGVIRLRPGGDYPYLVCGPLAFGPVHGDFLMQLYGEGGGELHYRGGPVLPAAMDSRPAGGKEIVAVLGPMMSSPVGRGYDVTPGQTVKSVNGKPIANFGEFIDAMRAPDGDWITLEFNEPGVERLVFRRKEFMDATESVMEANGIRQQVSKGMRARWEGRPQ